MTFLWIWWKKQIHQSFLLWMDFAEDISLPVPKDFLGFSGLIQFWCRITSRNRMSSILLSRNIIGYCLFSTTSHGWTSPPRRSIQTTVPRHRHSPPCVIVEVEADWRILPVTAPCVRGGFPHSRQKSASNRICAPQRQAFGSIFAASNVLGQ